MQNIDPGTRRSAEGVRTHGKTSAHFTEFETLARRNGYEQSPGGYIKNSSTGGSVARGWSQFAERVLEGNIPLTAARELNRAAWETEWERAATNVKLHDHGRTAATHALRGDHVRALSWLREAENAVTAAGFATAATMAKDFPPAFEPGDVVTITPQGGRQFEVVQRDPDPKPFELIQVTPRNPEGLEDGPRWVSITYVRHVPADQIEPVREDDTETPVTPSDHAASMAHGLADALRGNWPPAASAAAARDRDHAEAIELDDAREAYAHAGYEWPVTPEQMGAAYADWDAEGPSPFEVGRYRKIGILRRKAIELLAEMAECGKSAPADAMEHYAAGRFQEAVDSLTAALAADGPGVVDLDTFAWFLTERGKAALVAGQVGRGKTEVSGVCLRVDGSHVGHMAAVEPTCRVPSESDQDAHDAASEAVTASRPGSFGHLPSN